jgi:hypothetical protein
VHSMSTLNFIAATPPVLRGFWPNQSKEAPGHENFV